MLRVLEGTCATVGQPAPSSASGSVGWPFALYTLAGFFLVPWLAVGFAVEPRCEKPLAAHFASAISISILTFILAGHRFPPLGIPTATKLVAFDSSVRQLSRWSVSSTRHRNPSTDTLRRPVIQEERFASGETRFHPLKDEAAGEPEAKRQVGCRR